MKVVQKMGAAIVKVVAVHQAKRIKIIKELHKVMTSKVIHYLRRARVLNCLKLVGMT
jgi:hypothetical protein